MAEPTTASAAASDAAAKETMDLIYGISNILGCNLDRETLSTVVALIQAGVNPEALAAAVKELRREKLKDSLPSSLASQPK